MAHAELTDRATGEVVKPPRRRSLLASIEHCLGLLVEIPAALLVLAEIVILFAGVVARYGLHRPLIWSDELASILFLWLAMLGAAVAFRRAEHMRMTAVVASARPAMRAYLDLVATSAALAFLVMIAWPAYEYAYEESFITTPALQVPNIWRAAALPVGIGLMALFALLRLIRSGDVRTVIGAILSVALVIAIFWLLKGSLRPLGNLNLIIFFVGVAGFCVFAGVPIAFGFGLATYGYLALTTNTPLMVLVGRMDEGMSHLILLSVPLFVFLGLLIEMTGMARAMVAFLASLLGHVRGGLHYVLVGAMYLVSGISGSKAADMAAVAPVLFPEMKARGAKPGDLVALLAATGAQTETIPPSLVLITIGSVTGVSIAALFTGGLLPGVVLAITLSALALPRRRSRARHPGPRQRDPARVLDRPARDRAAVPDPLCRGRRHCDRDRGFHDRHRLRLHRRLPDLRPFDLPQFRLGPDRANAGRDRVPVGRDPFDYRLRHRHGLGADAVRLLAGAGIGHDRPAGRFGHLHRRVDPGVHDPRQRARGDSGDRAVRAVAVSDRAGRRRARGALRHDHYPGDGDRIIRATLWSGLLCRLRHRARRSRRRHQADLGLSASADDRSCYRGDLPVDFHRVLVASTFADET
jgi:TRAP-type C4-dicarboxylate transport system permease small subunit